MLIPANETCKGSKVFNLKESYESEEVVKSRHNFHVSVFFTKNKEGGVNKYYRLHSKEPMDAESILAFEIHCPKCNHLMKKIDTMNSSVELCLYECKHCNKEEK